MNSLIPLLAIGFDFGEYVPYLLGGGGLLAGGAAFIPKILEKFKKKDGAKPDISSILDILKGDGKIDISSILEKLGGDKKDDGKKDSGLADILQIGGIKANAEAIRALVESLKAQGFPTKVNLDMEFATGEPIHLEFSRMKKTVVKDGATA